jgi:uncharacterized membrane protein
MLIQPIDYFLLAWFVIAGLSAAYVAIDQYANNPEPAVMKWGFILTTLYTGPFGLLLYVLADKEPRPGEHEAFIKPLWKQGVGSTIHCVVGDATGIIVAAAVTAALGFPMWIDLIVEYLAGFAFGLFIFQSLFMQRIMGGSYWQNVRSTFLPEFISMNFMMAAMAPVMSFLMMGRDMRAMAPTELLFWAVMSLGVMAGFVLAYPANVWMVARKLKHGLMTERPAEQSEGQTQPHHAGDGREHPSTHETTHVASADSEREDRNSPHADQHLERQSISNPGRSEHHGSNNPGHAGSQNADNHRHTGIPVTAAFGRHPLHPMLVPIPIGLFIGALLTDLAFWTTGAAGFATASLWLTVAALVSGLTAAAIGLTDYLGSPAIRSLHHAYYHLVGNLTLLAIAAVNVALRTFVEPADAILPWGMAMSAAIVALLVFTGWHGGEMVFGHGVGMSPHRHGVHERSSKSSRSGGAHGKHGSGGGHAGHGMQTDATVPQLAAVAGVSLLVLITGMVAPANWVNLTLSARQVGGAIMPPGMIMDRDTPAEAMLDMAAVDPRLVTARYGADARGNQEVQPRLEGGVKVFELDASVVRWTILEGTTVDGYAFNGQIPGPRLRIREGDRVRIKVTNRLPESTSVHWHGLILPNAMDGPAEITQKPIEPGESYIYEFTAGQPGTFFYHSHDHPDRQQALGLYGALIIDPAEIDPALKADHEVDVLLQEWLMREGLTYPAMPMEGGMPNFFTINGRSYPATDTVRMKVGETLKVRFIGSSNGFIHPMHIHGGPFTVVARDGVTLPPTARFEADTINVGPGQRYDVIWRAHNPGAWLIHCHIPHHTTNNNTETGGAGGLTMIIHVEP